VLTTATYLLFSKLAIDIGIHMYIYTEILITIRCAFLGEVGGVPVGHEYSNFMTSVDDYNAI